MKRVVDLDLGKWLLCRLMVKQGYSQTNIPKNMKKNENVEDTRPDLDENSTQDIEESWIRELALSCV